MPSSATITSFITMNAGGKARASHVNTNFSNLRGHLVAIDPNTQASSHNTYDLGATDIQWRNLYLKNPPYINGTQLGKIEIETVYDASNATEVVEDIAWLGLIKFIDSTTTGVQFQFVVPDDYSATNRISLKINGYGDDDDENFFMQTETALYRPNTTDVSLTSPTNVLTSTSAIAAHSTVSLMISNTTLRLCNTGGTINSVTIAAGDILAVRLQRVGGHASDTNAGNLYITNLVVDLNN